MPLEKYPRLRVTGEVNDFPIDASLTPVRGEWYILLSKKILAAIDAQVGDLVSVRIAVADQDAVNVPEDLNDALVRNPEMQRLWDAATPGKRRGLAYLVASAKRSDTRQKRIAHVFDVLTGVRDMRGQQVSGED